MTQKPMMSQDTPIEILGVPQSNFVRAVRMVAVEKDLACVHHSIRPHSAEAMAIHPLGLVPGLRHGEIHVGESQAIVTYLDRLKPDPPMGPAGPPADAAEIAQWISIVATAVDRVVIRRYVVDHVFPKTADGAPDRAAIEAVLPELRDILAMLEARLKGRDFLAANRFTFADALLLATLTPARRFAEAATLVAGSAALLRYLDLHAERPSFIRTKLG
jgi:glutathione S-transferase